MKKRLLAILLALTLLLIVAFPVLAYSIGGSPGIIRGYNLPLGQQTYIDHIHVINSNNATYAYRITFENPVAGLGATGYENFPDLAWLEAVPDHVTVVGPAWSDPIAVYVTIPNDPAYANKKYEAWAIISGDQQGMFNLRVAIRVLVTTGNYIP